MRKPSKSSLLFLVLVSVCLVGVSLASTHSISEVEPHIRTAFMKWRAKYGKIYRSLDESEKKLRIFRENWFKIKEITDSKPTFTVGLNKFADMSTEEFQSMLIPPQNRPFLSKKEVSLSTENLPDHVDWREQGAVTPVIDQGQCGASYAFPSVGSLETLNKIVNGKLVMLSTQQIIDCSQDWGNFGCSGGFWDDVFQYVIDEGIESAQDYPYIGREQKCKYDKSKVVFQNHGFADVPANNEPELAAAVAQVSVPVGVDASNAFQFYTGGIISSGCTTQVNHGVLAVGYDNTGSQPYWIVKNTWGASWGENGYARILKSDKLGPGTCGIATYASYPTK